MTDQYDIDYAQQVTELLPPDKRYKNITAWLTSCMTSTLQYLRDALFGDYRLGSTVSAWVDPAVSLTPYSRGIKVNYKKGIYVSLIDSNTDIPTNTASWYFQQPFFIGLNERMAYNGTNLVFTYALNRWFETTFRQPGAGLSDIYITTNNIDDNQFQIGLTEAESSYIGIDDTDGTNGAIGLTDLPLGEQFNANFYVPTSLITALGPSAMALLSSFINMYIYAGLTYQIVVY